MGIQLAEVIRLKGMIDGVLETAGEGPMAAPVLVDTYLTLRQRCAELVSGTEVETEFRNLFPEIESAPHVSSYTGDRPYLDALARRARGLLGGLAGWLDSFPSAEALLDELIAALDRAEAEAEEPEEKERLAGLLTGLRGAGRQVAIEVIAAYLSRQV